jgi:hypothetical protein
MVAKVVKTFRPFRQRPSVTSPAQRGRSDAVEAGRGLFHKPKVEFDESGLRAPGRRARLSLLA